GLVRDRRDRAGQVAGPRHRNRHPDRRDDRPRVARAGNDAPARRPELVAARLGRPGPAPEGAGALTRLALTFGMLLAILTACAGTGDATPVASADPTATRQAATLLTPPPEPRPLVFPDDEAPHEDMTEWWYFTGHLFDPDGNRYGFE